MRTPPAAIGTNGGAAAMNTGSAVLASWPFARRLHSVILARPLVLLALAGASIGASALEPYVATGFPYALVGVSHAVNDRFAVRADFGTVAHHSYTGSTSDEDFRGSVGYNRTALLADWFVAGNGFRLTGGATFNSAKATLRASPHNGQISLGGVQYSAPSDLYYLQSEMSLPKVTPYLGIGWGHHAAAGATGLSFNVDLGAAIGAAKATPLTASPALASELALAPGGMSDLDQENRSYQDAVAELKAIPQLTIGLGYRF
jgi:hypothetical protein